MSELPTDHKYYNGRTCNECGEFKTINNFSLEKDPKAKDGIAIRSKCKPCTEFIKYKSSIKRRYSIDYDYYLELLEAQNNSCAICKDTLSGNSRTSGKLFVDHCHTTNKVRGLLCSRCNHGLGHFRDDQNLLQKAIEYLKA